MAWHKLVCRQGAPASSKRLTRCCADAGRSTSQPLRSAPTRVSELDVNLTLLEKDAEVEAMEPVLPAKSPLEVVASTPAPASLALLSSAFSLICLDVFGPNSLHVLQNADVAVHTAVSTTVSYEFRATVADTLISNTSISAGAASIVALLAAMSFKSPSKGLPIAAAVIAMNAAVGGVLFGKDALITKAVKGYFHRARPSWDLHHSFSFPSGHSTSVYFTLGTLFFIVLPAFKQVMEAEKDADSEPTALDEALTAVTRPSTALALTVSGGVVTQTGRLLADVHWFSDVLAGMCFGSCGVAVLYLALTRSGLMQRL